MKELQDLLEQRIEYIKENYDSPEKDVRIKEVNLMLLHISTENLNNLTKYKLKESSPKELTINTYWNNGGQISTLREALPYDHPENLWNWFTRTYPDLNPEFYDIYKPFKHVSTEKK